jgi:hypothetical protein
VLPACDAAAALPGSVSLAPRASQAKAVGPHPLFGHQFAAKARESAAAAEKAAKGAAGVINPLEGRRGTHGWIVAFDVGSAQSFEEARALTQEVLSRVQFDRTQKRSCPVCLFLLANKVDHSVTHRADAISDEALCHLMASAALPDALLAQMRRQKVDRPLYRLLSALVAMHDGKKVKGAHALHTGGGHGHGGTTVLMSEPSAVKSFGELTGISESAYVSVAKLKHALEPHHTSSASVSAYDALLAITVALRTPSAAALDPPADEVWERLLCCDALGVKVLEVSCKTNWHMRMLERVMVRSLTQLISADDASFVARGGGAPEEGRGAGGLVHRVTEGVMGQLDALTGQLSEALMGTWGCTTRGPKGA